MTGKEASFQKYLKLIPGVLNVIQLVIALYLLRLTNFSFLEFIILLAIIIIPIINLLALYGDKSQIIQFISSKILKATTITVVSLLVILSIVLSFLNKDFQIYNRALYEIVETDDTYGGGLNPSKVYISRKVINYPNAYFDSYIELNLTISEKVQSEVLTYTESLGLEVIWIDSPDELTYNELGEVVNGGVVVVFGELNKIWLFSNIKANMFIANLAAGGTEYKFLKWFNGWKLYDSSSSWIS